MRTWCLSSYILRVDIYIYIYIFNVRKISHVHTHTLYTIHSLHQSLHQIIVVIYINLLVISKLTTRSTPVTAKCKTGYVTNNESWHRSMNLPTSDILNSPSVCKIKKTRISAAIVYRIVCVCMCVLHHPKCIADNICLWHIS
jgi:hypothetical protein